MVWAYCARLISAGILWKSWLGIRVQRACWGKISGKSFMVERRLSHILVNVGYRTIEPVRLAYRFVRRPLSLGVRGMVLDKDGGVLLVRHTYLPGWFFPGGGVKRREGVLDGLHRELIEEVGVRPTMPAELFGLYSNSFGYRSDHVALFVVREFDHDPRPNAEIAEWGFFPFDDLPSGVGDGTRMRLQEYLGNAEQRFDW